MELERHAGGRVLVVRLSGEFDIQQAESFRQRVESALRPHQVALVVDLSEVTFIDSTGIGALLGRYKTVDEQGGRVFLASPSDRVLQLLELSGLTKVMTLCHDETEALKEVAG